MAGPGSEAFKEELGTLVQCARTLRQSLTQGVSVFCAQVFATQLQLLQLHEDLVPEVRVQRAMNRAACGGEEVGLTYTPKGGIVLMVYLRSYSLACPIIKRTQYICILRAQGSQEATECQDLITKPEIPVGLRVSGNGMKGHRCQKYQCVGRRG